MQCFLVATSPLAIGPGHKKCQMISREKANIIHGSKRAEKQISSLNISAKNNGIESKSFFLHSYSSMYIIP